jgi:hypothetical protein
MKLFIESILSASSMKASSPAESTPCPSGLLRGKSAALQKLPVTATNAIMERDFMFGALAWFGGLAQDSGTVSGSADAYDSVNASNFDDNAARP